MALEQQSLKTKLNQTLGLRNRKQKQMITFQFDSFSKAETPSERTSLPTPNRSIKNQIRYYVPRKGIKISCAYGNREDDNQLIKTNFFQNFLEAFSKDEQNFIKNAAKNVAKHHTTSAIISAFNISPLTFILGTMLLNLGGSLAQIVPGVNDNWTLNNYTVTEGPWDGNNDWCWYYNTSSYSTTAEYEFCNQFKVFDQNGNGLLSVASYFGPDWDWSGREAELDPPDYCQTIFEKCRSASTVLEQVKMLFNLNDPSIFSGDYCWDTRNVPVNLCPSRTFLSPLSDQGCYILKGCNSASDSSIFSKCIEQGLLNVTLNADDNMTYDPWVTSTDCSIPQPWVPPYPPLPSSTGDFSNQTLSDVFYSSPDFLYWFSLPFSLLCCTCICRYSFCVATCDNRAAINRSIKEERRRVKKARIETNEQFVIAKELLMNYSGSGPITHVTENITSITLSYLYDQSQKPKGFHNMLFLYAGNQAPVADKKKKGNANFTDFSGEESENISNQNRISEAQIMEIDVTAEDLTREGKRSTSKNNPTKKVVDTIINLDDEIVPNLGSDIVIDISSSRKKTKVSI